MKDFRKETEGIDISMPTESWPALDIDQLVTNNPNFWRAYYDIAPGDPGLMILHSALLLSAGEADRSSYLAVVAMQRPGVPADFIRVFEFLIAHSQRLKERPNALVAEGIALHDQGEYGKAVSKYKQSLRLWPQNGFAYFELGLSLRAKQLKAAGKELPPMAVIIGGDILHSPEADAAFAKSRKHDPFQFKAYQGDDQQVLRGLRALVERGLPAWQHLNKNRKELVDDEILTRLSDACQQAQVHDLALVARQILVARRGAYNAADRSFIKASLEALAPAPETDLTLKRLSGESLVLRQLIVPERPADAVPER